MTFGFVIAVVLDSGPDCRMADATGRQALWVLCVTSVANLLALEWRLHCTLLFSFVSDRSSIFFACGRTPCACSCSVRRSVCTQCNPGSEAYMEEITTKRGDFGFRGLGRRSTCSSYRWTKSQQSGRRACLAWLGVRCGWMVGPDGCCIGILE